MDTSAVVTVVCDRCRRPGWRLEEGFSGVIVSGARLGEDISPLAAWAGSRPGSYRGGPGGIRAGAFILAAEGPPQDGTWRRQKLVCIGRKHPRYERVVTRESTTRAYGEAVAAGRDRISMSEI